MEKAKTRRPEESPVLRSLSDTTAHGVSPWERLEAGRYQPRRIRGSFPGRELG